VTSTVLDVTVLLLCVSASVVALGAVGGDRGTTGAEAAAVADLVATETVTVTYASDEAPNGTRTVHATRAELLALLAVGGGERAPREAFESGALSVVGRGIGPRTRIDAAVVEEGPTGSANEKGSEPEAAPEDAAGGPPDRAQSESAAPTGTGGWQFGSGGIGRKTVGPTGTGVPWRIDRGGSGPGRSEEESAATESDWSAPIGVGSEPPRGADVSVAVITHPVPNGSDGPETVRIVIRRW
jgi:hypothetical protein